MNMYITRFNTVNDEVEEYLYHTEEEAKRHLELFKDDDSGLYTSIEVFDGNNNLLYHLEFDKPKYPDSIMRNVRETFGLEPDDTSLDKEINELDPMEVFERWLQWEGIIGYEYRIKEAVNNIFYRQ